MEIINLKKEKPGKSIKKTVSILKKGGLIVYPTETCYGLGAEATNKKAVKKLLEYKGKRFEKAISVAVANQKMAEQYVEINQTAESLYQNFLPGPLTVVSKSKGKVVKELESEDKTLGIRMPDYDLILQLIKELNKPITATSANTSGKKPPYSLQDLIKYTSKKKLRMIDLFLDGGKLAPQPPSSVVDTTLNEPKILRRGKIKIDQVKGTALISKSEEETKRIAQKIFGKHKNLLKSKTLIFALQGELGAGKTQFVKGIAQALKIKENVPSPTYILLREYPQGLYHIDTWRMESEQELLDLGLEKMLKPGAVICIEWLEKVKPVLEKIEKSRRAGSSSGRNTKVIWVTIDYLGENKREIRYK